METFTEEELTTIRKLTNKALTLSIANNDGCLITADNFTASATIYFDAFELSVTKGVRSDAELVTLE